MTINEQAVTAAHDDLATALFAVEHDSDIAWAREWWKSSATEGHRGDCPEASEQGPVTCCRCVVDEYREKAAKLAALAPHMGETEREGLRGSEWFTSVGKPDGVVYRLAKTGDNTAKYEVVARGCSAEVAEQIASLPALRSEIDTLKAQLAEANRKIDLELDSYARDAELASLRAQIKAKDEALEPFAKMAEHITFKDDDSSLYTLQTGSKKWTHVTAGDFRRARAAMGPG